MFAGSANWAECGAASVSQIIVLGMQSLQIIIIIVLLRLRLEL